MKTKFSGFLTLLLAFVVHASFAQENMVSGIVSDESGLPLPGTTVLIKGTTTGASTDFDGKYSIKASEGSTLVFSFIGYVTKEVIVGNSDTIDVVLEEDASELDEVVLVAYGSQSRASLTGAVSVIESEQIENVTFANPVKGLEGLVSGLRVVQGDGVPGSNPIIRIRGIGSINANSAPLIVLDGVPYNGSLNSINPQDIETTTVLKDASATSLYGNKAANGVLLITTKAGTKSKTQISIDTRIGITQRGSKEYNIIETPGKFYEAYHSVLANSEFYRTNNTDGVTPLTYAEASQFASDNLISTLGYNVYDVADNVLVDPTTGLLNSSANLLVNDRWEDALFRDNANFSSTNVNISGGSEDMTYYFSIGHDKNNGYTVGSSFKRTSARLNLKSSKILNVLTLTGNVAYAKSNSQAVPATFDADNAPSTNFSNTFFFNRRIAPIFPVFRYDQNWNPIPNPNNPSGFAYDFGEVQVFDDGTSRGPRNYATGEHPLASIENTIETNERDNFNGSFRAKLDLPFDINFEYVLNYLSEVDKGVDFSKPEASPFARAQNGLLTNNRDNLEVLTNQQLLTWKKSYDRSTFDVLLGHETYEEKFTTLELTKYNVIGELAPILNNASVYNSADNYNTRYLTEGYFSRLVYGLDDTYFFNISGRYDASSVFHPDERWGFFWSTGAAWILSNEDFIKDINAIDYAKLSASYGTSGNDWVDYPRPADAGQRNFLLYESQFEIGESNGELTQDPSPTFIGNRDVTWESTASLDVALETRLFDRVNLSLGYYRKKTEDLLFNVNRSPSTAVRFAPINAGTMLNSGIETELSWNIIRNDNVNINFNVNLSTIKNEVAQLPEGVESFPDGVFRIEPGKSRYDFYLVKFAGVNPDNGNAQYFAQTEAGEEVVTEVYNDAIGGGDGFVDNRQYSNKTAIPNITGGFGTTIDIGNFSLGLQFAYQMGGYAYDSEYFGLLSASQNITNFPDYDKTWTVNNPTASLPAVDPLRRDQYQPSDLYLVKSDYLGLNNINFGYTLQNDAIKKYHIDSIRFYSTINNAFLLYSAKQGFDPRLSITGRSAAAYPANRTIAFGVNININ
ncbi:TonB-dependent receptor [Flavobacteriaceae bacterium MHTCC 0001]